MMTILVIDLKDNKNLSITIRKHDGWDRNKQGF